MKRLLETLQNVFKIPDLRKKILFTLMIFVVYRIGGHIPSPGIDAKALGSFFAQSQGTLFGLFDLFVGGNLQRATIFALGIMPYISASIIFQLLTAVIPFLEKLQKEGEEGRRKITQYTRYATVGLASIQGLGISIFLEGLRGAQGEIVVPFPGLYFRCLTVLTLTCGTVFVMWLGEQITEKGIGNGISLIIFVGVLEIFPTYWLNTIRSLTSGVLSPMIFLFSIAVMLGVIAAVVLITQAQRRIPVQYAKRVIGRRIYGGQSTHLPLSMNTSGVIPIIFAQSVIMLPTTFTQYFAKYDWVDTINAYLQPGSWLYTTLYGTLIVGFAYFYTAIVINPVDMAGNMKKYGGFIPGIRPGQKTSEYIDKIMTRITLPGAVFFAFIAILPFYLLKLPGISFFFGGTALIILVGVALDTVQQIEAHLMMRHYEGFLKKGRVRGRR
ncbi:preprotein translocase subunit SecY [candidate division TA06 bacterium]|nr:preprotein translocase subunit SecY [candidate division TA06 bacterium]